ncbi:MAG: NUDIX family hydrolase [Candidatus Moranbacteria bacterium GW2011_GWF2_34_56]|nr:MAG: NUDIX family hydrolase [Candidatus Moranbacteria bacterium GW2011_GWF1_34_10]KKP65064.1 MAG: NUDIX family hydrolase [Candidatus Moranbacteria bacterium GW2011_GWF2_34_56]HBI16652.1 hypothetical protein [Candidatus Moranbacteria bacterium]
MNEKIIIVDENDNPIGVKERKLIETKDIYRVSALWIINSKNQILMAQRSFNKKNNPGKWGPAVAGTVTEGEDYTDNIIKETQEEIGIDLHKYLFEKIEKIYIERSRKYFCQWYLFKADIEIEKFTIQENEVEKVTWIDKNIFEDELKLFPEKYIGSMLKHFEFLKKY